VKSALDFVKNFPILTSLNSITYHGVNVFCIITININQCFNLPGMIAPKYEKLKLENLKGEIIWKRN